MKYVELQKRRQTPQIPFVAEIKVVSGGLFACRRVSAFLFAEKIKKGGQSRYVARK
jgi:hypothetical protein